MTATAATDVAAASAALLRCVARAAKNQITVAVREAHVPGPPPISPIPKNVPAAHAHLVLVPLIGPAVIVLVALAALLQPLKHLGIDHR
jgi:hypothetical protein